MDLRVLHALGVEEKSALLYITGLTLGTTSVQELARKAGMKRTSAYIRLDELVKEGLFERVSIGKKTYYRSSDPQRIEERLRKNLALVSSELPKLARMRSDSLGRPEIRVLEGSAGIEEVYGEIKSANSIRVWSNISPNANGFHSVYAELADIIREQGIRVREIIATSKEVRRYARIMAKIAGPTYEFKISTVEGIAEDTIIYGNVIAFFKLSGLNLFVVRIEDVTMASSLRAVFDMAWNTARSQRSKKLKKETS